MKRTTRGSRVYPAPGELLDFGRRVCGVSNPRVVIERIAQSMAQTLSQFRNDHRISAQLHAQLRSAWEPGLVLAQEIARSASVPLA